VPLPPRDIPAWAVFFSPPGKGFGKNARKGKGKGKRSAKDRLRAKLRSGRLSAKERIRLQKEARAEQAKAPPPAAPPPPPSFRPKSVSRPNEPAASPPVRPPAPVPTAAWSRRPADKELQKELSRILAEIHRELSGKPTEIPTIDCISPDAGQPTDRRNESEVRTFPGPDQILRLRPGRQTNRELARAVRRFAGVLRPYLAVLNEERILHERLAGGRRLLASGLKDYLAYGEHRIFADQRLAEAEQHKEIFMGVLLDTSSSMKHDGRLERSRGVAALLAECLRDCPDVETVFLGYNHNVYLCGDHEEYALGSLGPAGKTNEAAALDYLRRNYLATPPRRKVVLVLSDGLPTACSVEAVRELVRTTEKDLGVRFLDGALSAADHPAYRRRVNLTGAIDFGMVRGFGRALAALFR
jgi:Mg-chelatase subunit ChlD